MLIYDLGINSFNIVQQTHSREFSKRFPYRAYDNFVATDSNRKP